MGEEKTRIARAAAAMVRPGDTIGLNGGTTATEVAREVALLPDLTDPETPVTIVTNAVNIASELTVRQCVRVVVTGGAARAITRVFPIRLVSNAWPSTLLILCAPVWFRFSRLRKIVAFPQCLEKFSAIVTGVGRPA